MKNKFGTWLQDEREKKGFSQTELAKQAKLDHAIIRKIESGSCTLTPGALKGIAKALNMAPESVFRKAGLIPPTRPLNPLLKETIHLLRLLDQDDLEETNKFIRKRLDQNNASPE